MAHKKVAIVGATLILTALAVAVRRRRKGKPKAEIRLLESDPIMGQEKVGSSVHGNNCGSDIAADTVTSMLSFDHCRPLST